MTKDRTVTSRQVATAFAIAVAVDIMQVPATLAFVASLLVAPLGVPAETLVAALDSLADIGAAVVINRLLGFHWTLLPTVVLEVIPVVDAAPTWTACVAYVVMRRRREGRWLPAPA
jgi:hypothetical protein